MVRFVPIFEPFRKKPTLADQNRTHFRDQEWQGIRKKVVLQTTAGGVAFILWFLGCLCYIYGSLYMSPSRHASFHVVAVDYDGGVVGQAVQAAYEQLRGPGFFTLVQRSPTEYPTQEDVYRAVWEGDYWASISVNAGASERLAAALQGGEAAATYNPAEALHYVWNQQYYTVFSNSIIQAHMNQLIAATRMAYNKINGTKAAQSFNETNPASVQAFLNPIQATATNVMEAQFGTVLLLNTISMAMPIMQQFFFLLVLNGVLGTHHLYKKMTVQSSLVFRRVAGLLFTLGAALCQTGYYWAFREGWQVDGKQFFLTWMTFWLLMHIHLLILDTISTVAPLPVMPFVVLLWVLLNISSSLSPLEVQPAFYHWMVALPSHEAYSVMVTIWSSGSHNRLYRALPILFSWWVVANLTTTLTHFRACHLAFKLDQEDASVQSMGSKDEEAGLGNEAKDEPMALQNSLTRPTSMRVERQRTVEQAALERREVYGPSIPPLA
jgi:hypothetical protein